MTEEREKGRVKREKGEIKKRLEVSLPMILVIFCDLIVILEKERKKKEEVS